MNTKKNLILVVSIVAAIIVFAENYLNIFEKMINVDAFTLFVLLRSLVILGMSYTTYLCFVQNKKGWVWTLGLMTVWTHASLVGGSISLIATILNLAAAAVVVGALFRLRLEEKSE